MSIAALVGDGTTTTSLAVASGWPEVERPVVVEADPTGGSLAAWLDTPALPSLATVVAQVPRGAGGTGDDGPATSRTAVLDALRPAVHPSRAGISFVAAPVRSIAAARAIDEAAGQIFPALAATDELVALVDVGRHPGHVAAPPVLGHSDVVVACHRQCRSSARAAAVRLERFADDVVRWSAVGGPLIPVVIGDEPFDPDEISRFLAARSEGTRVLTHHVLADDPLGAAVLAGHDGVSARRLQRLPLMRTAASLAARICDAMHEQRFGPDRRVTVGGSGT